MSSVAVAVDERRNGIRERLDSLTSPSGLFIAAVVVILAFPVTRTIQDPDFWWHLRAGQLIIQHGGLLGNDPFTYTVPGHHWTMHEWLNEVLFAIEYAIGGLGLIVFVLSAVTWAGLLCVMQKARLRHPGRGALGAGMLIAVVAGFPIWGPRVQMITFAFAALTLLLVERHLVRGGKAIWWLVPLFLLWTNFHSGFVIGLGFIAIILVAELVGGWLHMPDPAPRERLRPLLFVLIASIAVSMINPNGPTILLYALGTQTSGAQQSLIEEWFSPELPRLGGARLRRHAAFTSRHSWCSTGTSARGTWHWCSSLPRCRCSRRGISHCSSPPQHRCSSTRSRSPLRAFALRGRRLRRTPESARARTRALPPLLFRLTAGGPAHGVDGRHLPRVARAEDAGATLFAGVRAGVPGVRGTVVEGGARAAEDLQSVR